MKIYYKFKKTDTETHVVEANEYWETKLWYCWINFKKARYYAYYKKDIEIIKIEKE